MESIARMPRNPRARDRDRRTTLRCEALRVWTNRDVQPAHGVQQNPGYSLWVMSVFFARSFINASHSTAPSKFEARSREKAREGPRQKR
ncbi:uncharacterized protein STEHIDRAFT_128073 [Stereum hirsutum FP-91666 SS1]|uniref:uncharacterized protein n=1 Tax=Stereum hirsutum (strain FP-91666) TaxID=721885 RepID=UPI000440C688|nr:uncharacterized protein STEHIDRAFT_128073 [Stereum hirsutum FP-91666 SS1]EIM91073.1 hypothetical protein STEHIDRAFT_128073 [Stereum hirsutum FP-91666 SS1]